MKRIFIAIYRFFESHRLIMWLSLLLLTALCLISAFNIHLEEDISSFLPNNESNRRINEAYKNLGKENQIIVRISNADTSNSTDYELLEEAADAFANDIDSIINSDIENYGTGTATVTYQIEQEQIDELTNFVVTHLPYFLDECDYERIDSLLTQEKIDKQLETDRQLLMAPLGSLRTIIQNDPLFFSSRILHQLESFRPDNGFQLIDGYLFSEDGSEAVIVIQSSNPSSETARNQQLIEAIDNECHNLSQKLDNAIVCSHFGTAEITLGNSQQIQKDSLLAVALSLIFILALLIYYYRNFRSIFLILLSTLAGGLFALAVISLCKSSVSIIALGVASIIIGIAINYPIHFLSHFKRTDNKEQIIKEIVSPLLIGNITTVGAFVSLMFISSDAMKDFGLFAALLLAGTILFVLIFVPQLMGKHYKGKDRSLAFAKIAEFRPENYGFLLIIVLVLSVIFFFFSQKTSFDTNMHNINYMTDDQRIELKKIATSTDENECRLFCIAEGDNLEEVLQEQESLLKTCDALQQQGTELSISGIGRFVPSQQEQRIRLARWKDFWSERQSQFIDNLDYAIQRNGFSAHAFDACKDLILQDYEVFEPDYFLKEFQQSGGNYIKINAENHHYFAYNLLKINKNDLQNTEKVLNDVSPDVYAFAESSIASRLVQALSDDFDYVLFICGLLVFTFLMISFGRLEISLMAFTPLVLAWIWILGIMGLFDIRFNIVNIILATFIFGMGDDYSIFVTEGLIYEYRYGRKMLSQFKNSIILSSTIMFLSIGMLIFAKHPAMKSLAEVTIVGMLSVVIMAYLVPPFIFRWLTQRKGKLRRRVVTLGDIGVTLFSGIAAIIGSLYMTLGSWIILGIGGKTKKNELRYHKMLCDLMKFIAKAIPRISYRIDNRHGEDFSKPAVIICNHQSHFDLIYTLMLSPKIVVLTNRWALNFPFYRSVIRGANFQPAEDIENNLPQLKKLVDEGYSILVFPEGTRSQEKRILRFHQGAFFLAQELGIDLLPILLHGTGDALPKHELLFQKGRVCVSIEQRISYDNENFRKGKTTLEFARLMRHFYQDKYAELVKQEENAAYFLEEVRRNYLYKGPEVARECRQKLKDFEKLQQYIDSLPDTGHIEIDNCGIGVHTLLAALVKKDLQITAYDSDQDALATARNCVSVPENLTYELLPVSSEQEVVSNVKM